MIIKSQFNTLANYAYKVITLYPVKTTASILAAVILLGFAFDSLTNTLKGRVNKENSASKNMPKPSSYKKPEQNLLHQPEKKLNETIFSTISIDKNFTENYTIEDQRSAHVNAKDFLLKFLPSVGSSIEFILPPSSPIEDPENIDLRLSTNNYQKWNLTLEGETINSSFKNLDPDVFTYQTTKGVREDIIADSQNNDEDSEIIYVAASQFNGAEAPSPSTLAPGTAVKNYQYDMTQGPQAQLAYSDEQVELLNCAANIGYNGLVNVLDENTKVQVKHGYLMADINNEENVISNLKNYGHKLEFPCITGRPHGGKKLISMILTAAPARGFKTDSDKNQHMIQYLCALKAFRAQFQHSVNLAQKTSKKIILKSAAVGLGAFYNHPLYIGRAFYSAACEFQDQLKEHHVIVQFQVFEKNGHRDKPADYLVNLLGLTQYGNQS